MSHREYRKSKLSRFKSLIPTWNAFDLDYITAPTSVYKERFTKNWVEKTAVIPQKYLCDPLDNSEVDSTASAIDLDDTFPDSVDHIPESSPGTTPFSTPTPAPVPKIPVPVSAPVQTKVPVLVSAHLPFHSKPPPKPEVQRPKHAGIVYQTVKIKKEENESDNDDESENSTLGDTTDNAQDSMKLKRRGGNPQFETIKRDSPEPAKNENPHALRKGNNNLTTNIKPESPKITKTVIISDVDDADKSTTEQSSDLNNTATKLKPDLAPTNDSSGTTSGSATWNAESKRNNDERRPQRIKEETVKNERRVLKIPEYMNVSLNMSTFMNVKKSETKMEKSPSPDLSTSRGSKKKTKHPKMKTSRTRSRSPRSSRSRSRSSKDSRSRPKEEKNLSELAKPKQPVNDNVNNEEDTNPGLALKVKTSSTNEITRETQISRKFRLRPRKEKIKPALPLEAKVRPKKVKQADMDKLLEIVLGGSPQPQPKQGKGAGNRRNSGSSNIYKNQRHKHLKAKRSSSFTPMNSPTRSTTNLHSGSRSGFKKSKRKSKIDERKEQLLKEKESRPKRKRFVMKVKKKPSKLVTKVSRVITKRGPVIINPTVESSPQRYYHNQVVPTKLVPQSPTTTTPIASPSKLLHPLNPLWGKKTAREKMIIKQLYLRDPNTPFIETEQNSEMNFHNDFDFDTRNVLFNQLNRLKPVPVTNNKLQFSPKPQPGGTEHTKTEKDKDKDKDNQVTKNYYGKLPANTRPEDRLKLLQTPLARVGLSNDVSRAHSIIIDPTEKTVINAPIIVNVNVKDRPGDEPLEPEINMYLQHLDGINSTEKLEDVSIGQNVTSSEKPSKGQEDRGDKLSSQLDADHPAEEFPPAQQPKRPESANHWRRSLEIMASDTSFPELKRFVRKAKPSLAQNERLNWRFKPNPVHLYFESKILPNRPVLVPQVRAPLHPAEIRLKRLYEENEPLDIDGGKHRSFAHGIIDKDGDSEKLSLTKVKPGGGGGRYGPSESIPIPFQNEEGSSDTDGADANSKTARASRTRMELLLPKFQKGIVSSVTRVWKVFKNRSKSKKIKKRIHAVKSFGSQPLSNTNLAIYNP